MCVRSRCTQLVAIFEHRSDRHGHGVVREYWESRRALLVVDRPSKEVGRINQECVLYEEKQAAVCF